MPFAAVDCFFLNGLKQGTGVSLNILSKRKDLFFRLVIWIGFVFYLHSRIPVGLMYSSLRVGTFV